MRTQTHLQTKDSYIIESHSLTFTLNLHSRFKPIHSKLHTRHKHTFHAHNIHINTHFYHSYVLHNTHPFHTEYIHISFITDSYTFIHIIQHTEFSHISFIQDSYISFTQVSRIRTSFNQNCTETNHGLQACTLQNDHSYSSHKINFKFTLSFIHTSN